MRRPLLTFQMNLQYGGWYLIRCGQCGIDPTLLSNDPMRLHY